jgi:hypothetical protein
MVLHVKVELSQGDLAARAETGTQVGGAGQDPTEMVALHELQAGGFNFVACAHETSGDLTHISAGLHGNDTHVIFLVHPDKQVLVIVVVDTTGIGPMATHTTAQEQGGVRLLEQVASGEQVLLLLMGHTFWQIAARVGLGAVEWEVGTGEIALQGL